VDSLAKPEGKGRQFVKRGAGQKGKVKKRRGLRLGRKRVSHINIRLAVRWERSLVVTRNIKEEQVGPRHLKSDHAKPTKLTPVSAKVYLERKATEGR